jgi:SAM-dependent methyltransferase
MKWLERIHGDYVYGRRLRVLGNHLLDLLPPGASVLDVGAGDGLLAHLIQNQRPDLAITAIDVLVRGKTYLPVQAFDGKTIPKSDDSFDIVMFVDVLHHTEDAGALLAEATRVARKALVIKDHLLYGLLAGPTLRFMDWVGNARHGVALPYKYWSENEWNLAFSRLHLKPEVLRNKLNLYPWPAKLFFDRKLHFVGRFAKCPNAPAQDCADAFHGAV